MPSEHAADFTGFLLQTMMIRTKGIVAICAAAGLLGVAPARAELFTLTDTQGRSIQAEIIAVEGDAATIKRADGQAFKLPLEKLTQVDQARLREWAKDQKTKAPVFPAGAIKVTPTKKRVSKKEIEQDVTLTTQETIKAGKTITEEQWGYELEIVSATGIDLSGLKIEYRLFVNEDNVHVSDREEGFRSQKYSAELPDLPGYGRTTFTTKTMLAKSERYAKGIRAGETGARKSDESLAGIWVKIYRGKELIYDWVTPERLRNGSNW